MNKKEMVKVLAKIARENNYVKRDMLNAVYDGNRGKCIYRKCYRIYV